MVPPGTVLTERDLAIDTIVYLDQYIHEWPKGTGGAGGVVYFISKLPRFDVECI